MYDMVRREPIAFGRHLYVLPAWRGSLLSARLMLAVANGMKKAGIRTLMATPNKGREKLWESGGFEPTQVVYRKELWPQRPQEP